MVVHTFDFSPLKSGGRRQEDDNLKTRLDNLRVSKFKNNLGRLGMQFIPRGEGPESTCRASESFLKILTYNFTLSLYLSHNYNTARTGGR